MRAALVTLTLLAQCVVFNARASAHGDQPHPTCKKGYVLTDAHKCVRAPA
jgi:hypothetical protein